MTLLTCGVQAAQPHADCKSDHPGARTELLMPEALR